MSAVVEPRRHTAEEYLALERAAPCKSEFHDGQIFAMTGASREHNLISVNLAGELRRQLKGRPCEAYVNDLRVKVSASGDYCYPDVIVVCGSPQFEDDQFDTLLNPTVLIEVLSPSTEAYDRGDKFLAYRRLDSLREYLLVSQDKAHIDHYVREGEHWVLYDAHGLEASLHLESIDCVLELREVYDRVLPRADENTAA